MQAAAMTNRFLTGCSSKLEFADSEIVVRHGTLIRHTVASHLAQTVHSLETSLKLANALIHSAEQAYMLRNVDALLEASTGLMNLPIDAARQIGLYYKALGINREGHRTEAEALLEKLADDAPITYRARAIQTLGANHHDKGQLDEALRLQFEVLRVASDKNANGLHSTLLAHLEIATVTSLKEDHRGALAILESISPLVQIVSQQNPLYFYFYHNELAVEFGELNRIAEAEAASAIALASPFAKAYPEWAETRQELDAKRTSATPSIVAINRAPEAVQSAQPEPRRKPEPPRSLAFSWAAGFRNSFHISATLFPATARSARIPISILDRVLIGAGPRAPPPAF
jgi:tetratricopeptide (TPR) repeat protein